MSLEEVKAHVRSNLLMLRTILVTWARSYVCPTLRGEMVWLIGLVNVFVSSLYILSVRSGWTRTSRLRTTLTPFCSGSSGTGDPVVPPMIFSRSLMCMIMNRLLRLLRMISVIAIKSCGGFNQR
uniref:AV3 protein n=1 Tax=Crassocephalum yellow vein virus TaxID=417287 RepID=A0A5Q0UTB9_9GEMI|nr:AV3 protein [Crassocephalum yellow vein virus]